MNVNSLFVLVVAVEVYIKHAFYAYTEPFKTIQIELVFK